MKAFNTEALKKAISQLDQGIQESVEVSDNELMRDKANMVYEQAKLFLSDVKKLKQRFDELR